MQTKHLKNNLFQAYITNYPSKLSFTISAIATKPFTMTLISCSTEQHDIAETFTPTASYLKKSTADPGDTWAPVGQELSSEASKSWGKSPEVPALDPVHAELNSMLPGTHTHKRRAEPGSEIQQEAEPNLWFRQPQLTQPGSFQSHGMIEGGQIMPARKESFELLALAWTCPVPRDTTSGHHKPPNQ